MLLHRAYQIYCTYRPQSVKAQSFSPFFFIRLLIRSFFFLWSHYTPTRPYSCSKVPSGRPPGQCCLLSSQDTRGRQDGVHDIAVLEGKITNGRTVRCQQPSLANETKISVLRGRSQGGSHQLFDVRDGRFRGHGHVDVVKGLDVQRQFLFVIIIIIIIIITL
jgi:hypothetical protein